MKTPLAAESDSAEAAALGSAARAHAPAAHGRPTEGEALPDSLAEAEGTEAPRLVIRGESWGTPHPQAGGESYHLYVGHGGKACVEITPLPKDGVPSFAALTDWLNITFPFDGSPHAVTAIVRQVADHLSPKFGSMTSRGRGLYGFTHSFDFDNGNVVFAYGGQRGMAYLSLSGEGCALVADWNVAHDFLKHDLKARITRWDGAVDDFRGEHSVDTAMTWYLEGGFGTHGNQPKMKQVGNWVRPDGSGRTLYVGNRLHGKMMRIYEKGKQLGDPESPWTRWELELKNRDRFIPFDVLLNPGPYVAGAYACLGWINEEASRIRTIQKTAHISYAHLTDCLRTAYGRHLNVMMEIEGSSEAVLEKLVMPGMPRRLRLPDIDIPPEAGKDHTL